MAREAEVLKATMPMSRTTVAMNKTITLTRTTDSGDEGHTTSEEINSENAECEIDGGVLDAVALCHQSDDLGLLEQRTAQTRQTGDVGSYGRHVQGASRVTRARDGQH